MRQRVGHYHIHEIAPGTVSANRERLDAKIAIRQVCVCWRRCGVYEGQSGAPWWIRLDAVTTDRYLVAIQSGYVNTALPAIVVGPRLAGYGGEAPPKG